MLQQLTQLGRTDSAVGAPIDFTTVQKYNFFAQSSVYVFYVYVQIPHGFIPSSQPPKTTKCDHELQAVP